MRKKRIIHSPQFKAKVARQVIEDRITHGGYTRGGIKNAK